MRNVILGHYCIVVATYVSAIFIMIPLKEVNLKCRVLLFELRASHAAEAKIQTSHGEAKADTTK